jgi:hypothetical protein
VTTQVQKSSAEKGFVGSTSSEVRGIHINFDHKVSENSILRSDTLYCLKYVLIVKISD